MEIAPSHDFAHGATLIPTQVAHVAPFDREKIGEIKGGLA